MQLRIVEHVLLREVYLFNPDLRFERLTLPFSVQVLHQVVRLDLEFVEVRHHFVILVVGLFGPC